MLLPAPATCWLFVSMATSSVVLLKIILLAEDQPTVYLLLPYTFSSSLGKRSYSLKAKTSQEHPDITSLCFLTWWEQRLLTTLKSGLNPGLGCFARGQRDTAMSAASGDRGNNKNSKDTASPHMPDWQVCFLHFHTLYKHFSRPGTYSCTEKELWTPYYWCRF